MLLYYITDRTRFHGNEADRRRKLLAKIAEAARCGVDYIQLRERDLIGRDLEMLARHALKIILEERATDDRRPTTRLLINSRTDVALAVGADGVHLRSDDVPAATARSIWNQALARGPQPAVRSPVIAVSCHAPTEVLRATSDGADFAVFAPVFGKQNRPEFRPTGLDMLHEAGKATIPVLALGGVTIETAASCIQAGAAGIAGIRLFQDSDLPAVVSALRQI